MGWEKPFTWLFILHHTVVFLHQMFCGDSQFDPGVEALCNIAAGRHLFLFCFASSSSQTVEERRTVRDSQGKEETTVTRSGGPGNLEGPEPQTAPLVPGQWVCLTLTKINVPIILTVPVSPYMIYYMIIFSLRWPTSIFRHAGWWLLILQVLWGV